MSTETGFALMLAGVGFFTVCVGLFFLAIAWSIVRGKR